MSACSRTFCATLESTLKENEMNKKNIQLSEASRLINHGPCVLVSVGDDKRDNLFTVAWNMPVSKDPAKVAIESSMSHFSYSYIERTKEFCINVPTADIADKVLAAGKISGAKIQDKFAHIGLSREPSFCVKAPRVKEAVAHLECRVLQTIEMGKSALIIAEVLCAAADENSFSNGVWQFENGLRLLHHLGGNAFSISEKKISL
jgi:flavin reductase (DIM6/NTAB) family NADH-FMN oxidoreductase RutF